LVTGGHSGNYAPTNTAEIYDPATGAWTIVSNMLKGRARHSIALLADGRVLVAGGWNVQVIPATEIFDPATSTWSATGRLITGRDEHSSAVLGDGRVLVAGGLDRHSFELDSTELYSP
jgi:N-acetylneuraminic acid mutarotase